MPEPKSLLVTLYQLRDGFVELHYPDGSVSNPLTQDQVYLALEDILGIDGGPHA